MHGVVREPAGPLESVGRELVAAQPRAEYLGQARDEIAERFESLDAPGTIRRLLEDSRRRPEAERRRIFTARQSLKPRSPAAEPLSEPVRRQVGQFPESADAPAAETRRHLGAQAEQGQRRGAEPAGVHPRRDDGENRRGRIAKSTMTRTAGATTPRTPRTSVPSRNRGFAGNCPDFATPNCSAS